MGLNDIIKKLKEKESTKEYGNKLEENKEFYINFLKALKDEFDGISVEYKLKKGNLALKVEGIRKYKGIKSMINWFALKYFINHSKKGMKPIELFYHKFDTK